jgi:hypothetical protein
LPYWSAAVKKYRVLIKGIKKGSVSSVVIDPDGFIPDIKPANNKYIPQN